MIHFRLQFDIKYHPNSCAWELWQLEGLVVPTQTYIGAHASIHEAKEEAHQHALNFSEPYRIIVFGKSDEILSYDQFPQPPAVRPLLSCPECGLEQQYTALCEACAEQKTYEAQLAEGELQVLQELGSSELSDNNGKRYAGMLLILEAEVDPNKPIRRQLQDRLDAFREAVTPSQEYGIIIYEADYTDLGEFVSASESYPPAMLRKKSPDE